MFSHERNFEPEGNEPQLPARRIAMKVVSLDKGLEDTFWRHVSNDPLEYHFFIYDWKYQNKDTKIWLALEEDSISGLMLLFADRIASLRGSPSAVTALLRNLNLDEVEINAPRDCEDVVLERYRSPKKYELMLMHLEKGQQREVRRHETARLSEKDVPEIAELLMKANYEWLDKRMVGRIKKGMNDAYWLGIRRDNKIVSVGYTRFVDLGSNIGIVATDETYRNRGYASAIVAELVDEILKRSERALIHVLKGNSPAVRAYEKVGFRPHNSYLLMREARRV